MSQKGKASIRSIITQEELESFIISYRIPPELLPCLPGPDDPTTCSLERIVIYTLSFSFCCIRYPLTSFKKSLLKRYDIHFSQLHPLAFLRIVHIELSCASFARVPSAPLFWQFYRLWSGGDWFAFEKRKENIYLPCYSFMTTSTYPKEWKNQFIFVSPSLLSEHLFIREPSTAIEDYVPPLSVVEDVLSLCGVCVVNQEMCDVLGREAPNAQGLNAEAVPGMGFLPLRGFPKRVRGFSDYNQVEDISSGDEDLETRLSQKRKPDTVVGIIEVVLEVLNIRSRLRSASNKKSQPASQTMSKAFPIATKVSLSTHLKVLRPTSTLSQDLFL
ncbi:hypothetical protein Hdeb2414_s0052g00752971 [Helianthus debilis subsp. tardiflorus]